MAETEEQPSNSRRIAKNALMLYIRMFLSMIVGLYTSRVVLNTLGVEDYGIYGVVGGVVGMMGFLNASMSGATSRFITFELGKGNIQRLKDTFSSALIVHIGIALIVLIVAETVGLWFLNNKLVIPENRMYAAHWVYQLSILSAMLGITQVPYNACIIAHERMGVYAYIEILNVSLKLLIVYLLLIGDFDKLILYAILTLAVSIIVMMITRIYCIRKFSECHFHWVWNKEILKPLLSFSGWDLYGNMCVTARQQGTTFLINMFFGVALNAAASIATTISGVASRFGFTVVQAFRPQIIKQYAKGNIAEMQHLMGNTITFSTLVFGCVSIPIIFEANYLLFLWLGIVPQYSVIFCQIILLINIIDLNNYIINTATHASGYIKGISIISGTIYLICVPILYILYKYGLDPYWAYITQFISMIVIIIIDILIVKNLIPLFSLRIALITFIKNVLYLFVVSVCIYFISHLMPESLLRLCISSISSLLLTTGILYWCVFDQSMRHQVNNKIVSIFKLHKKS